MFTFNDDLSIYATRGDIVFFTVSAQEDGEPYKFQAGDVVRIKVYGKKDAESVVLQKDFPVTEETESVEIFLSEEDTKIGEVISKPKDYWYEVELNPGENPQTIIGYDEDGAKVFKLFPEGDDIPAFVPDPEDIAVMDDELDMTSTRPVQNQAIARAVVALRADFEETRADIYEKSGSTAQAVVAANNAIGVERKRIDNLVSNPTSDNAEVVDIRVGANGKVYGSAGTAVREQIKKIDTTSATGVLPPNATILENKYYNGSNVLDTLNGFTTIEIPVTAGEVIVIRDISASDVDGLSYGYIVKGQKTDGSFTAVNMASQAIYNDAGGVVIPNSATLGLAKLFVCVKTEAVHTITIVTSKNIGVHSGGIEISKLPSDVLTIADIPITKNIISAERKIGNSGIRFATADGEDLIPYYTAASNFVIYGPYFLKAGSIANLVYGEGLGTIGFFCDSDFNNVVGIRTTTNPYIFKATTDGYAFFMDTTIEGTRTSVTVENPSLGGMIPSYLLESAESNLAGKKWVSFGDSITERGAWQERVVREFGFEHTNCGIGSTCLSGSGATAFWQKTRLDAVKKADPDIVTILGGANDLVSNPNIGTKDELEKSLENKDTETFVGAYSYIIENLLSWKPTLEIMVLGTTWAHNDGATLTSKVSYSDFSNACKMVAEYYGLPFVDLHNGIGFNKFTMSNPPYNIYSNDHIHPNALGGRKIASMVIAKMKEAYA